MMVSATQALAVAIAAALTVTYSGKGGYVVKCVSYLSVNAYFKLLYGFFGKLHEIDFILSEHFMLGPKICL